MEKVINKKPKSVYKIVIIVFYILGNISEKQENAWFYSLVGIALLWFIYRRYKVLNSTLTVFWMLPLFISLFVFNKTSISICLVNYPPAKYGSFFNTLHFVFLTNGVVSYTIAIIALVSFANLFLQIKKYEERKDDASKRSAILSFIYILPVVVLVYVKYLDLYNDFESLNSSKNLITLTHNIKGEVITFKTTDLKEIRVDGTFYRRWRRQHVFRTFYHVMLINGKVYSIYETEVTTELDSAAFAKYDSIYTFPFVIKHYQKWYHETKGFLKPLGVRLLINTCFNNGLPLEKLKMHFNIGKTSGFIWSFPYFTEKFDLDMAKQRIIK